MATITFELQRFQPLPPPTQSGSLQPKLTPARQSEISYEKRIAVIALRLLCGLTFSTIGEKLELRPRSAHRICSRAQQRTRADLRDSFQDVAKNVKDAPRSGRPAIHPPGYKRVRSKKKKTPTMTATGAGAGAGATSGQEEESGLDDRSAVTDDPAVLNETADMNRPVGVGGTAGVNGPTGVEGTAYFIGHHPR